MTWQPPNSPWLIEGTEAELRRLTELGHSASQIAAALCVKFDHDFTRNAVIGKCHRLGIKGPLQTLPRIRTPQSRPRIRREKTPAALPILLLPPPSEAPMQPGTLSNVWIITHRQPVKLTELKNETWIRKKINGKVVKENIPGNCRWPIGPLDRKTEWFCGAPALLGGCPYCEFHDKIALRPATKVDMRLARVA